MVVNNKQTILIMIVSTLCLVITLGLLYWIPDNNSDIKKFKKEYESYNNKMAGENKYINMDIETKNDITILTEKNLLETLSKETGIFYFGFPTCPWCRNIVEPLLEVAKEEKVKVYYFNPQNIRGNESDTYQKLINKLKKYLTTDEYCNVKLFVPDVYFVKNGNIMANHLGSIDSQKNPYIKLTDVQEKEIKKIYLNKIREMK